MIIAPQNLNRLSIIFLIHIPAVITAKTPKTSAIIIRVPPTDQASYTGGAETKTVAKPPNATNPIIPTLKSPAKPHCRFTPSDIIALIRPIFKISSAVFQL